MKIISIIGGGVTGCALIVALCQKLRSTPPKEKILIQLFETGAIGKGLAYNVNTPELLLNVSVSKTSIVYKNPLHFWEWLNKYETVWRKQFPQVKHYNKNSFLPRALCAIYIKNTLEEEIKSMSSLNIAIKFVKKEVVDIQYEPKESKVTILTNDRIYSSNFCILCTGYGDGIPQTYQHLEGRKNYFNSLYLNIDKVKKINKKHRILIIGTRQSAVDACILLNKKNHITIASRSGAMPAVRNKLGNTRAVHLTKKFQKEYFKNVDELSLNSIKKEIEQELSCRYKRAVNIDDIKLYNPYDQLIKDINLARKKRNFWENSITPIVYFIDTAWNYMSFHDKKSLIKNELWKIQRYISAMPIQNAEIISQLLKNNQLSLKDSLSHVDYSNGKFIATYSNNHVQQKEYFDVVINATNPDKNLARDKSCLYQNMIHHGKLKINHFGGILVDHHYRIPILQFSHPPIYAAGSCIRGAVLVSNFMYFCAKHSCGIANELIKKIYNS